MNCFPCFSSQKNKKEGGSKKDHDVSGVEQLQPQQQYVPEKKEAPTTVPADYDNNSSIKAFNFRELASATKNFRQECLLGEGSLGKVYKGTIQATGQEVAVKQLDRNAMEGGNEFFVEVGQLSLLQHPNLVSLVGYCADGDQRLLVFEFMPGGSLEDHLHGGKPLDWVTRMKIAQGTAQGLQYLHEKAKPPIIYRDLKSSKVLLDDEFNPKLSNIGIDKLGSSADSKMPMQSKIMDNNGYNAPECMQSGTINAQTDVYSFGVVLLELISGRKALDPSKPQEEQNLVAWAQPIFKEPKNFPHMADPSLNNKFPERGLNQAVAMAAMCVQEEAAARPLISDLSSILSFLSMANEANNIPEDLPPPISGKLRSMSRNSGSSDDEASVKQDEDEETDNESGSDDASAYGNGDRSLSHKSSGRSLSSFGNRSGRDSSLSRKKSSKSGNYSSYGSDASEGNSEDDEGNVSSSNEKDDEHSEDDKGNVSSSTEKADERRNDSLKSNSSATNTRKKEKTSKGHKSSSKKKKPKDENDSSCHRSSSTKKGRRKAKKRSDKDDDHHCSAEGSQPEN
ncbi:probable serine/threonine-protein kinase PBL25 [Hibiscus syriacus]|uniref:probable serine/threonine-protein kinase PBL25 n=1 Tax=Hibiscus syriacus TaxID=106335 RepID=UPI001921C0F4|nr:probable serine/threonine-protein kinase PBL25 [Hibiscus syriacus]